MRVLVCGPRDWTDYAVVFSNLTRIHAAQRITCLIEGGASGVDKLARLWAEDRAIQTDPCPVDPTLDGVWPSAGPRRNRRMLKEKKPDRYIAFVTTPPTRGTADMVKQADRAVIPGTVILI